MSNLKPVTSLILDTEYLLKDIQGYNFIPVKLFKYGMKGYYKTLSDGLLDNIIEILVENKEFIYLDEFYLSEAVREGRLFHHTVEASIEHDNDIIREINKMHSKNTRFKLKPIQTFYDYVDYMNRKGVKPLQEHIELIGKLCSFKEGWIFYACKDLNIKMVSTKKPQFKTTYKF